MYNIRNNAFQGIFKMSADDDQNLVKTKFCQSIVSIDALSI